MNAEVCHPNAASVSTSMLTVSIGPTRPILHAKKLHARAIMPQYQTNGAACFDLHAVIDRNPARYYGADETPAIMLPPGCSFNFAIGIAFEVPPGWVMHVHSRSGHGFKHGVRLCNSTGIIDSDFRGEMRVKLHNDSLECFTVQDGDRVAQCMLVQAAQWHLQWVDDLTETARGAGGYGSTGR